MRVPDSASLRMSMVPCMASARSRMPARPNLPSRPGSVSILGAGIEAMAVVGYFEDDAGGFEPDPGADVPGGGMAHGVGDRFLGDPEQVVFEVRRQGSRVSFDIEAESDLAAGGEFSSELADGVRQVRVLRGSGPAGSRRFGGLRRGSRARGRVPRPDDGGPRPASGAGGRRALPVGRRSP